MRSFEGIWECEKMKKIFLMIRVSFTVLSSRVDILFTLCGKAVVCIKGHKEKWENLATVKRNLLFDIEQKLPHWKAEKDLKWKRVGNFVFSDYWGSLKYHG